MEKSSSSQDPIEVEQETLNKDSASPKRALIASAIYSFYDSTKEAIQPGIDWFVQTPAYKFLSIPFNYLANTKLGKLAKSRVYDISHPIEAADRIIQNISSWTYKNAVEHSDLQGQETALRFKNQKLNSKNEENLIRDLKFHGANWIFGKAWYFLYLAPRLPSNISRLPVDQLSSLKNIFSNIPILNSSLQEPCDPRCYFEIWATLDPLGRGFPGLISLAAITYFYRKDIRRNKDFLIYPVAGYTTWFEPLGLLPLAMLPALGDAPLELVKLNMKYKWQDFKKFAGNITF